MTAELPLALDNPHPRENISMAILDTAEEVLQNAK